MKKTINGKRFDTSNSIIIWAWSPILDAKSPTWFSETLYRRPRGDWFLVGQGKRLSPYGAHGARGRISGEKIVPLSHKEALTWLKAHDKHGIAALHQ